MRSLLRRRKIRRILVIFTLVSGTPAAGASMALAQECAAPCLQKYGRFEVLDGHIYWYSGCTTTGVEGEKVYFCMYKRLLE